jgi:hypothetical protein
MAKLNAMPDKGTIDAMKGCVDFYLWKGIPVARKWPKYPKRAPSAREAQVQSDFAYINKLASQLPEAIIDQYKKMAVGTDFTWKDLLVRGYMHGFDY